MNRFVMNDESRLDIGDEGFHFLIADPKDIYFTSHYMKLDFEQRLFQLLKQSGYTDIFFFSALNMQQIEVSCETLAEADHYRNCAEVYMNTGRLWRVKCPGFEKRIRQERTSSCYSLDQKKEDIRGTIDKLIRETNRDRCVFIFPVDVFSDLYSEPAAREALQGTLKERFKQGSLFLLVIPDESVHKLPSLPEVVCSVEWAEEISSESGSLYEKFQKQKDVKYKYWEPFSLQQMERMMARLMLERGNPKDISFYTFKNAKALYESMKADKGSSLFLQKIGNHKELYHILSNEEKFDRLKKVVSDNVI